MSSETKQDRTQQNGTRTRLVTQTSLDALAKYRPSFATMPRCHVCRRPALRGRDICFRHSGRAHAMTNPHKRANAVLRQLEREGLIPADLVRLETWQRLRALGFRGALRAKELLVRFCEREVDPNGWIRAVRDA